MQVALSTIDRSPAPLLTANVPQTPGSRIKTQILDHIMHFGSIAFATEEFSHLLCNRAVAAKDTIFLSPKTKIQLLNAVSKHVKHLNSLQHHGSFTKKRQPMQMSSTQVDNDLGTA